MKPSSYQPLKIATFSFFIGFCSCASAPTLQAPQDTAAAPVSAAAEHDQLRLGLRPPKRARPLAVVLVENSGTETTDALVPWGVLRASGEVDVLLVATQPGPVTLVPALRVQPELTTAEFISMHPDGADYLIVPAIMKSNDLAITSFVRTQRDTGATIVGICNGGAVLGEVGLLDGRRATGHWFDGGALRQRHPQMQWVNDRRFVVDNGVATTTGVSASLPFSLTLVEAIAGAERARALADELGVYSWNTDHDSAAFVLDVADVALIAAHTLAFWQHETLTLHVGDGIDELSLAFTADAWSRTARSTARTHAATTSVRTRLGLVLLVDDVAGVDHVDDARDAGRTLTLPALPGRALTEVLAAISARYDEPTAAWVAKQLEFPR